MEEQGQEEGQAITVSLGAKIGMVALPMLPTILADVMFHGGMTPPALAAFGLSYLAWDRSPKLLAWLGENEAFLQYLREHEDWRRRFDRATKGYFSKQLGQPKDAPDEGHARIAADGRMEALHPNPHIQQTTAEIPVPLPSRLVFSKLLARFTPSLDCILLGALPDGTLIFCAAKDLCHVALAGATGGGKSSILRLLVSQLCKAGASVLLLNPHYTRYDREADPPEDWTPFEPYLLYDPMECRKYEVIEYYLKQVAEQLLPKRLEQYAQSQPLGKPYFIVLDELPAIVAHVKNAPDYLAYILREGRKVGIYLITAAQDFLVSTVAPGGGGAIRDCYRTAYYVGGDGTTAKTLLDKPARDLPETDLGQGHVMLRSARVQLVKAAQLVRVPYVDNQTLYSLLGPSTFEPGAEYGEEEEEGLVTSRSHQAAHQEHVPQGASVVSGLRTVRNAGTRRQEREQRLRGITPASQAQARGQDDDLTRGIAAYRGGATTIDAFQAAMGFQTQHQARQLWARVKLAIKEEA
jgi:hypothetical protein